MGFELNLHFLPLAEFLAEASHGRRNAQILQFCRMQLVRQGLNIGGYLQGLLLKVTHTGADFSRQIGRVVLELFYLDCQQGETLTDVVVKISANPGTFLLLCLNQLTAHVCERRLRQFTLGDVDKRDHGPDKLSPSPLGIRPVFSGETCSIGPPQHLVLRVDSFASSCYPVNSALLDG